MTVRSALEHTRKRDSSGRARERGGPALHDSVRELGLTDTVTSYSHAYRALQPPSLMDRYAALPSLHFGWDLLVGLTLVRFHPRAAVRVMGALMPVAMAFAVVLTANHYVLDVVVGGGVAMAGLWIASVLVGARAAHPRQLSADGLAGGATWSTRRC